MTTDPVMPVLPEGYFWRITKADSIGDHRLQIRKTIFWFYSITVWWGWLLKLQGFSKDKIQTKADQLYKEWRAETTKNDIARDYL